MSFTSSQDLSQQLRDSTTVQGDPLANFYTNLVKGGLSVDQDGAVQRDGLAWWMQPWTNNKDSDSIALKQDAIKKARGVEATLRKSGTSVDELRRKGLLGADVKLTNNNVQGLIRELSEMPNATEERVFGQQDLAATRAHDIATSGINLQGKGIEAQLAQGNNQVEIARLDRGFDREQLQANTNLQLQLGMLAAEQQDQRLAYDKETRMMDRKDRAIAQILSGLGETASFFVQSQALLTVVLISCPSLVRC